MDEYILSMKGISKGYPGVQALSNVSLAVKRGEVRCLMGENGAGKSTIIKILAGAETMDSGEIHFNSQFVQFKNPEDALKSGISFIYQELSVIEPLTVEENITLGYEATRFSFVDRKKNVGAVNDILAELDLSLDPRQMVRNLTTSEKQMMLIAKAFSHNAKLIVLDEPTAALTDKETGDLFRIIGQLKAKGVSFLFVSHRFEDIFSIGDTITVFRDGANVGELRVSDTDRNEIIRLMIGRDIVDVFPKGERPIGEELLRVEGLSAKELIRDISFTLRQGQILGVSGLAGAGKTELARALFGDNKIVHGKIYYRNEKVDLSDPRRAIASKIAFLPEERRSQGIVGVMSVRENISMASGKRISRLGVVSGQKDRRMAKESIGRFRIATPGPEQQIRNLSGGNQQKTIVAKWMNTDADVILLDEPTRGIDVGAKKEIYDLMHEITAEGKAIIMFSSELPEILGMCDEVLVLREGRLMASLKKDEADQEKIMSFSVGGMN